jgi:hypothetical protein
MPVTPTIRCHFCEAPLDPNAPGVYRRVTGWTRNRRPGTGGTHQLALPGPATGFACSVCIDMKTSRGPAQTETLF